MSEESQDQAAPKTTRKRRPKRTPIGRRNILTVGNRDPKFEYRWVNDHDGRLQMFEDAGYEAVKEPTEVGDPRAGDASQLGSTVRKPVGGGKSAVLMRIPRELYHEDQDAKEQRLRAKEQALLQEAQGEGFYVSEKAGDNAAGLNIRRPKVQIE